MEETAIVSSEELNQAVEIKYVPVAVEEEEPEEQTIFEVVEQIARIPERWYGRFDAVSEQEH